MPKSLEVMRCRRWHRWRRPASALALSVDSLPGHRVRMLVQCKYLRMLAAEIYSM